MLSRPISRASRTFFFIDRPSVATVAAEGDGGVGDLLDAVDVAGEAGGDDAPALVLVEQVVEHLAHGASPSGSGRARRRWWSRPAAGGRPRSSAIAPMRARSVRRPSTGVRSSFQSPVCRIMPCGVWKAVAKPCGTEWVTGMNSQSNGPDLAALAVVDRDELGAVEQPGLLDAVAGQPQGERRAVDRERQLRGAGTTGRRRGPRGRG